MFVAKKMRYVFLVSLSCLLNLSLRAQSVTQTYIGTGGAYFEDATAEMSFSLGEPVATYYLGNVHLCQGFQQAQIASFQLPLELLSFEAKRVDDQNAVTIWNIAAASDVKCFIVERGQNAVGFDSLAMVSFEKSNAEYRLSDTDLGEKSAYYRLKIVHYDASVEYSALQYVEAIPQRLDFSISPNPNSILSITVAELSDLPLRITVFDSKGAIMQSTFLDGTQRYFEFPDSHQWENAVYQVQLQQGQRTAIQSFLKIKS